MAQSPLGSFDPFATHPFTNNSGLLPAAPHGSTYPMQFNAARQQQSYYPQQAYSSYPTSSPSSGSSTPSTGPSTPLYSPQAHRGSPSKAIFVPYQRSDASSPELVLKKKLAYNTIGK